MRTNRNRIVFEGDVVYRFPVQADDKQAIEIHAANQRSACSAGLPVPEVLEVHPGGTDPYIVMGRAPGTPLMETPLDEAAQVRLAEDLAQFLEALWAVKDWPAAPVPWPALWDALAHVAEQSHTVTAARVAAVAPVRPAHGDLSPGNLMVQTSGRLTAVLDWDAATTSDPATDFSALCANIPLIASRHLRETVAESASLDERAQAYLDTWPVQNDLWQSDRHPWLAGHRPLSRPRI